MKYFLIILLSLFSSTIIAQKAKKPNIILIVADDLGYGDIGCYGQQKIETPYIDKLAKEGMKFTQFYAGTAVCAPSRASLMTGLHTGHTPVRGNKGTLPEGQTPLPDSSITFVNQLQKAGYNTGAFGKWVLGYITTSGAPDKKGFSTFYGYNCQSLAHNYYPDHLWSNHERIDLPGNLNYDSAYSADLIHQQALEFLRKQKDKPFFIFLPYTLPHGDVIAPHDSVYKYYIKKFNEHPLAERPAGYSNMKRTFEPYPHAAFAAMVSRLDKYVGEIVAALKANGSFDNTLIIFTSDNGPHKENGGDPDFFNSNGKWRGIKRDLYEGGIRVPFIAYWKGKIQAGVNADPAAFWDLYPTFLNMAGIINKGGDGLTMLPLFFKTKTKAVHDYFYWEFHEQDGKQAVRWKDWKGIRLNVSKDSNAPIELYDLKTDPGEQHNLASKHADIVKRIEVIMNNAHVGNKDWPLLVNEK
jgi:arylsulfatase A-like enzyme